MDDFFYGNSEDISMYQKDPPDFDEPQPNKAE